MSLSYSYVEADAPSGVPARKVNGGLYTGTPAQPGAPWGNVPIVPEAHVYVVEQLKRDHIPGYTRPGNNTQTFPSHQIYKSENHTKCILRPSGFL